MKVILLIDDKKIGKRNEIKEVSDGYARNVLIPKKIAVEATNDNLNKLKNLIEKEKREYAAKVLEAKETAEKIKTLDKITVKAECSKEGKMFGTITSKDISQELNKLGIVVKKQDIVIPEPIKTFGTYIVTLKLFSGIQTTIKVFVEKE